MTCLRAKASSWRVSSPARLPAAADLVDQLGCAGAPRGDIVLHRLRAAQDDREQVVEVVGDPAGEPTEALQLLRLLKLPLQVPLVGHIAPIELRCLARWDRRAGCGPRCRGRATSRPCGDTGRCHGRPDLASPANPARQRNVLHVVWMDSLQGGLVEQLFDRSILRRP